MEATISPFVEVRWSESLVDVCSTDLPQLLSQFGCQVLHHLDHDVVVSVLLCDKILIRELNVHHRGIDGPTDVLSFGQWGQEVLEQKRLRKTKRICCAIGDIVIAVDVAKQQASTRGEPLERELCRLLLHGMLHLLGMDHSDPPLEEEPMLSLQEEILETLR